MQIMSGFQDQFKSAADSLHDYPITTLLIVVHFITVLFKIRVSEGRHNFYFTLYRVLLNE